MAQMSPDVELHPSTVWLSCHGAISCADRKVDSKGTETLKKDTASKVSHNELAHVLSSP